jgi:hypothetical protein
MGTVGGPKMDPKHGCDCQESQTVEFFYSFHAFLLFTGEASARRGTNYIWFEYTA